MRRIAGSWGGFTQRTHTLMLVLVMVLGAGSAAGAGRRRQQELMQEGDDTECLKGIVDSVRSHGQEDESSSLVTWTLTAIRNPCNYTSKLTGISCNRTRVSSILLPASNLAGNIPSSLPSCYYLHTLDLSSNSLSGPLPPLLGALSFLSVLSLSNNNLSGPIPYELATLASLTSLDLNHNQLSGSIPAQLGLLQSLQFFNVSHNKLSGRIPSTLSNTSTGSPRFNASSFAYNPSLYGYPLPLYPFSPPPTSSRKGLSWFTIVWIGIVSGLASMTLSLYGVWLYTIVRDRRDQAEKEKERTAKGKHCHDEESNEYIGWKEVLDML